MNCPHCGEPISVKVEINGKGVHIEHIDFEQMAKDHCFENAFKMFDTWHNGPREMTQGEIAGELGVGLSTVRRRMKKLGVKVRRGQNAQKKKGEI